MVATKTQGFVVYADPHVCNCDNPRKQLSTHRTLTSAVVVANAHWLLYLTFWGDYTHWLNFIIVDTRDGVICWRNGRQTRKETHGENTNSTGR